MEKKGYLFDKFKDLWVLARKGETPDGVTISVEPVHLIAHSNGEELKARLIEALSLEQVPIPEPDYDSPEFKRTVFAKALGLKTYSDFYRHARCFHLVVSPEEMLIEEWSRGPRSSFLGTPLWKKKFKSGQMDELVAFLIRKTSEKPQTKRPVRIKSIPSRIRSQKR